MYFYLQRKNMRDLITFSVNKSRYAKKNTIYRTCRERVLAFRSFSLISCLKYVLNNVINITELLSRFYKKKKSFCRFVASFTAIQTNLTIHLHTHIQLLSGYLVLVGKSVSKTALKTISNIIIQ